MTSENFRPMTITDRHERVAVLVAADEINDAEIAKEAGITDRQLRTWKLHPDFTVRVEYHRALWREQIEREGIANHQNRVDALNDRWHRMQQVVDARADYFKSSHEAHVPGGDTGLLTRTEKQIGAGPRALHVVEYAVDTGLLRELRAHEEQAAKELGQWEDKTRVEGEMLVRQYIGVNPDEV